MPFTPRGSIPHRLRAASDIAEARHSQLLKEVDHMADPGTGEGGTYGGGQLTRAQFTQLLTNDPNFQAQVTAKLPWASEAQRQSLMRSIEKATPPPPNPSVTEPPPDLMVEPGT